MQTRPLTPQSKAKSPQGRGRSIYVLTALALFCSAQFAAAQKAVPENTDPRPRAHPNATPVIAPPVIDSGGAIIQPAPANGGRIDAPFATTYYYKGSGSVTVTTNWATNRDGTGANPPNFTTAGDTFAIQNTQTATATAAWTVSGAGSSVLIETGGAMTSGAFDHSIPLSMQSGAAYVMNHSTYGSLSFGTINANSTFNYQATIGGIFRATLTYGNILWNYTGGADTPGSVTTTGSLTNNTGGSRELRVATGSTPRTWTIGADLTNNSASILNLNNGTGAGTAINLSGSLTNSGTINKTGAGATSLNFNGSNAASVTWGTVTNTNFSSLSITVASTKTLTFIDSLNEGAAAFTVNGTLNIGAQVLSGTSGTFTLASGATFITSNATGLNGAITVTGTRTFSTGANYEFQGAATGALLPSTVNNLTINRSSGNVALNGAGTTETVSNTLNVFSGNLDASGTRTTVSVGGTSDAVVMRGGTQINSNATVNLTGASGGNVVFDAVNNGTATIASNLGLGGVTRTFNIANGTAATDMSVSGIISNSAGGLTKTGAGTLTLSGNNSFTGTTTISGGTLEANATGGNRALGGTTNIIVNAGGTLLTSSAQQFNAGTPPTMSLSGGKFDTGGTSQTLGALTLTASSTIDMGTGASILSFGGTSTRTGGILTIDNWSGDKDNGLGTDQIYFANSLAQPFLDNINFTGFSPGAIQLGTGELVPIPEPSTWIGGALALGFLGWSQRKRFARLLRRAA